MRRARSPAAEQSYVAVPCSVCHTRMLATLDQVGGKLICPDCGTATVVPPPPPPRPKIDPMADAGEGYRLVGWDDKGPIAPPPPPVPSHGTGVPPAQPAGRGRRKSKLRRARRHRMVEYAIRRSGCPHPHCGQESATAPSPSSHRQNVAVGRPCPRGPSLLGRSVFRFRQALGHTRCCWRFGRCRPWDWRRGASRWPAPLKT